MVERAFSIEGMSCQHCVMAVKRHLAAVSGVEVREVRIGSALVAYDDTKVNAARIEAAIVEAGFRLKH